MGDDHRDRLMLIAGGDVGHANGLAGPHRRAEGGTGRDPHPYG